MSDFLQNLARRGAGLVSEIIRPSGFFLPVSLDLPVVPGTALPGRVPVEASYPEPPSPRGESNRKTSRPVQSTPSTPEARDREVQPPPTPRPESAIFEEPGPELRAPEAPRPVEPEAEEVSPPPAKVQAPPVPEEPEQKDHAVTEEVPSVGPRPAWETLVQPQGDPFRAKSATDDAPVPLTPPMKPRVEPRAGPEAAIMDREAPPPVSPVPDLGPVPGAPEPDTPPGFQSATAIPDSFEKQTTKEAGAEGPPLAQVPPVLPPEPDVTEMVRPRAPHVSQMVPEASPAAGDSAPSPEITVRIGTIEVRATGAPPAPAPAPATQGFDAFARIRRYQGWD